MTTADINDQPSSLPSMSFVRFGMADMATGLKRWPLWASLAWMDVRQRYRRSILGPFWITLSLGIMVLGLGVVYGALFNQDLHAYLPYLATGYIVWGLISTLLTESPYVFIVAHDTIKQIPFPLSTFVYRMVVRNLIVLAHNLLVYLVVILVFGINPGLACLLALPGLLLIGLNGLGFGFFLGLVSARFRDIPQLVINASQLIFFVTPILWHRETIQSRAWVASLNPFTYLVDIVREPMLGHIPSAFTWEISGAVTFLNLAVSIIIFARYRWRIPYWL
jgi:ABC-2 type transport system permease protein/lipopolysaccharide transport system permease protein